LSTPIDAHRLTSSAATCRPYRTDIHLMAMATEPRDKQFLMRITETESRMIELLAEHTGLSRADVVRQLVRREYAQVLGDAPKKRKR
jgi:hypothetical protein